MSSLLEQAMEQCTLIEKRTVKDGYGGYTTEYYDGIDFMAAIVLDTSTQAKRAEKEGVTSLYTITTDKTLHLGFHDIIRRDSDGQILRVTSEDKKTPISASLDMRQVSAERWELTNE